MMIDMLEDFPSFCLSKMMLKAIPSMISSGSSTINKFFDSATYKPPLLAHTLNIPWPDGQKEFIFPSETSLITEDSLNEIISHQVIMNMKLIADAGKEALANLTAKEELHGINKENK